MADAPYTDIRAILQRALEADNQPAPEGINGWIAYFRNLGISQRPHILAVLAYYGGWKDGLPLCHARDSDLLLIPNFGRLSFKQTRAVFPQGGVIRKSALATDNKPLSRDDVQAMIDTAIEKAIDGLNLKQH